MAAGTASEDIQTAARAAVLTNPSVPGIDVVPPTPPNADCAAVQIVAGVSTPLFAANPAHLGRAIYNGSGNPLYVRLGGGASTALFTTIVPVNGYYEVPFGFDGIIHGFSATISAAPHVLCTAVHY